MLDCNATCKNKVTRLRSEVVLPPSSCKVDDIDEKLGIIELTLTDEKCNTYS